MEQLTEIQERNKRVELDKAWETSIARRGIIASLTYLVAVIFMYRIGVSDAYLNALVPTGGYLLSTLSLRVVKRRWIKNRIVKDPVDRVKRDQRPFD
ncbi:hypothetical protein KC865_02160 [Candidatus Kaiserbacteria bacterium]|nr:hypothetical protein [Candidatus Kaiserbacteria bacterium]USN92683.1 MAG: hypothetical protein H6782_02625 [Candidatus Nomurabacteria bacterium]